ncbi:Cellular retinaldehyde binding/alpha-tocopherol transport [Corchorus olitorius]|uniref:Cellular retinaldehyde binding/alpha-tocopherol transport n=1 Tax=Corchorus olitorius TaxID=93759 RepID=A0A1R3I8B9_9ROSI|nr:Cellular retinaldehyde binding/alpha-tocopherol transport [Corchorus olitorius]
MAEETQKPEAAAAAAAPPAEEVVVEKPEVIEKEPPPSAAAVPEPEPEPACAPAAAVVEEKDKETQVEVEVEEEKPKVEEKESKITQSESFKEETNIVGELPEPQKKALEELKQLIQDALNKHEFTAPPPPPPAKEEEKPVVEEKKEEKADAPAEACEEPKVEKTEEKTQEVCEKVETEAPPAAAPAEVKEEEKTPAPPAEEEKTPAPPAEAPAETVVVTEVVEKVTAVVDDDGAKTVEAIEETVVAVSAPPPAEEEASACKTEEAPIEEEPPKEPEVPPPPPEEVSIWGIPLLADERSDVILLKFLRARDFKVKDAFTMIKNTVRWRKEFGIESLLEEDLGNELEKVVFMQGFDKEGHPVCYNVYGEFLNKELYQNTFADEEKRSKFLRWRIQFLEKSIRKLDFSPSGINTIVQVNDLKNSPGPGKKELRQATRQALNLLQDNYPEFVAKQVFINVPWWYLAFNRMISPFLTQRTKSKFVFAGPPKSAETLFRYIAPEQVPVQYGGLSREGEQEFTVADAVTEVTIKPASKHCVEFPITEKCNLVWELRVVGWDVNYGAEFVPSAEDGYTVIVSKARKVAPTDEAIICDSFKTGEPGKVVLTIDNQTSKKKKLLYRSKTKPYCD